MSANDKKRHLPTINGHLASSSVGTDGVRRKVYPADVKGRFTTLRKVAFFVLIAIWILLPILKVDGRPAVFLDVVQRRFYLFGATFNAQDLFGLALLLTGVAFSLVALTAMLGRVFCGWLCPQTVFLEGIFRPIERLIMGNAVARKKRDEGPTTAGVLVRRVALHAAYITMAVGVAHIFVGYFVSLPRLFSMMRHTPSQHPEAFVWMLALSGVFYFNFSWFREQTCLVVCPYGRMQSILFDEHSVVIGYDAARGEPRGKKEKDQTHTTGDCVDCDRCVRVCPTGIDIRNGLQVDCIACAACIDACDEVMDKLHRPRGLVRYDSQVGLVGGKKRIWRPRAALYLAVGVVWSVVAFSATRQHHNFEANLLRGIGAPYTIADGKVSNTFELHIVNKQAVPVTYTVAAEGSGLTFIVSLPHPSLPPMADARVPIFVSTPVQNARGEMPFELKISRDESDEVITRRGSFIGGTGATLAKTGQTP
ncbi:MAG: cytochrome c oxidase accessory protein CcoG [Polyangiaceae bacterium]